MCDWVLLDPQHTVKVNKNYQVYHSWESVLVVHSYYSLVIKQNGTRAIGQNWPTQSQVFNVDQCNVCLPG